MVLYPLTFRTLGPVDELDGVFRVLGGARGGVRGGLHSEFWFMTGTHQLSPLSMYVSVNTQTDWKGTTLICSLTIHHKSLRGIINTIRPVFTKSYQGSVRGAYNCPFNRVFNGVENELYEK